MNCLEKVIINHNDREDFAVLWEFLIANYVDYLTYYNLNFEDFVEEIRERKCKANLNFTGVFESAIHGTNNSETPARLIFEHGTLVDIEPHDAIYQLMDNDGCIDYGSLFETLVENVNARVTLRGHQYYI